MTDDLIRHSAILRRAVMRARPDFYGWDAERREHYRIHQPASERFILESSVFYDVYGVDCATEDTLRAAWDDVPIGELNAINETLLPWQGIGEDSFYLNEHMTAADRLRFDTLDAYACDNHAFQETERQKDCPEYVTRPYQGNLHARWARLFVDGKFRYATLNSLADYLYMYISELGENVVDTLIPYQYVSGPNDGKREGNCFVWDMRPDAGGLEPQLDELKRRLYRYEHDRGLELLGEFDRQAATTVYMQDINDGSDELLHCVFSDKTAMAKVRLRRFMHDCRCLAQGTTALTAYEQREADLVSAFLHAQYDDIMRNFNPKVAKLKRRRKILMHKDALQ